MDTDQWPQGGCTTATIVAVNEVDNSSTKPAEKKPRPEKEQALNCPRCNSTNTKFCYYNNYSLSQPRYFCKTCRRYWTQGGSLRTVPVGGGSRKNNKRSISNNNNPNSISSKKILPDLTQPQNPNKIHTQQHDLNLAYNPPNFNGSSEFFSFESKSQNPNYDPSANSSFMELFKNGNLGNSSRGVLGLSSFMSAPVSTDSNVFSSGFAMSDQFIKPSSLSFSLDGLENGFENLGQDLNINPSRSSLFPFEDVKMQVSSAMVSTNEFVDEQNRGTVEQAGEANGYWSGMLAGGSSW